VALSVALTCAPATAWGQGFDAEVRIDQMQPPSAGSPFTRAEGPFDSFDEGIGYAFQFVGDYAYRPLRSTTLGVTSGDEEIFPVEHALLFHLGASISPLDWLMIESNFPFAVFEEGTADTRVPQQTVPAGSADVGDVRVGLMTRPYESEVFDFGLGTRFWIPSGQRSAYLGGDDAFLRWELVPSVAGEIDLMRYGCTAGIAPMFFGGRDGDRLALSCAAQFKLAPLIAIGIEPHVAAFSFVTGKQSSQHTPGLTDAEVVAQFEPLATLAVTFGEFSLSLAGGFGVGGAPGTAGARAGLQFTYASSGKPVPLEEAEADKDADLDGIVDKYDACPQEAGTKDRRGCPDKRDYDGDGIVAGDACPKEAGATYDDPKANGCPDRDNDHFADPVDDCPREPGPKTGGCPKYARLEDGDFVVDPPIAFPPGRATLPKAARAALVEVIQTLRANPNLRQVSVSLSTKNAGNALVDKRAAAILSLFEDYDLDTSRFEVVLTRDVPPRHVDVHIVK
jgi:hypothetical protein